MPPPDGIICKWCNGKFLKSGYAFHEKKCQPLFEQQHVKCEHCDNWIDKDNIKVHEPDCKSRMKKVNALKAAKLEQMRKVAPPPAPVAAQPAQNDTASRDVPETCEECSEAAPTHICNDCDQFLCSDCDGKLHAKGARAKHIRKQIGAAEEIAPVVSSNAIDNMVLKGLSGSFDAVEAEENKDDDRVPCNFCGRKFAMARVAIHENVCSVPKKARKAWDIEKKRTEGTDFAEFAGHRSTVF